MRGATLLAILMGIGSALADTPAATGAETDVPCPRGGTLLAGAEAYEPYLTIGADGVHGLDVDVVRAVLERLGCAVTFQEMPWPRHLFALETGEVDLATSAAVTPEREAYAHFTTAYVRARIVLFARAEDAERWSSLEAFFADETAPILGAVRGHNYSATFQRFRETRAHQVEETNDNDQNLQLLTLGRIDGTPGNEFVMSAAMDRLGVQDVIVATNVVLYEEGSHIMFSKASVPEDFVSAFNRTLETLMADGTLEEIFARYL